MRTERRTKGETDIMKLIVAFHNFVKAPKIDVKCILSLYAKNINNNLVVFKSEAINGN